jgi:hypothetical protein
MRATCYVVAWNGGAIGDKITDMGAPDEVLDRPARKIRPRSRRSFASALSVGLSAAGILAAGACLTPAW